MDGAVGSPPYAVARIGDMESMRRSNDLEGDYGEADGQLGNMPGGEYSAALSSPPFESVTGNRPSQQVLDYLESGKLSGLGQSCQGEGYGETPGNIGEESGNDFWSAARMILDSLYLVLADHAKAIWVLKAYVKDKKIENFPEKWARLCEASGFNVIHWHRSWLTEERGTQYDMEGNKNTKVVKHYSFFKNIHVQKYPELEVAYEVVICTEKI
jgi:hypothetical protein